MGLRVPQANRWHYPTLCKDRLHFSLIKRGYLACGVGRNITIHKLRDVLSPEYFYRCLPLVQLSEEALRSLTQDDLITTEMLLSPEIASASRPSHHLLANRALIRTRLKNVALAIEDAKESLRVRSSPIGHIAMAVTLLRQSDRESALRTFDRALYDCDLTASGFSCY